MALPTYAFLALSEAALETILPALFFRKFSFFNPPPVFTFEPRKTMAFAILPLAITDFFIAFFMTFAFMTFAFMAFAFMAAFFMAFMASWAWPSRPSSRQQPSWAMPLRSLA